MPYMMEYTSNPSVREAETQGHLGHLELEKA